VDDLGEENIEIDNKKAAKESQIKETTNDDAKKNRNITPKKRGRPSKSPSTAASTSSTAAAKSSKRPSPKNLKKSKLTTDTVEPKKRGRKPKGYVYSAVNLSSKQPKATLIDAYEFSSDEDVDENTSTSDEEFKLDESEQEKEEEEDESGLEDDDDGSEVIGRGRKTPCNDVASSISDQDDHHQASKTTSAQSHRYATRRRSSNRKSDPTVKLSSAVVPVQLDSFDLDLKIDEWSYELDPETSAFTRPKLPCLSDDAIKPFISAKSNPPKLVIYECPFCKRILTYTVCLLLITYPS
jgi:hypothetical protein